MQESSGADRVRIGTSGPVVSALGVGTWAWGDKLIWGFGRGYGESDLRAAFDSALRGGIDFFDTAEVYGRGRSERFLGGFATSCGRRLVIASKFMPFPWRIRRGALRRALARSLDRLGIKKIDLYQVHWPYPPVAIETWMNGMADAVEAGLVGAVGVSNYDVVQMKRAHAALAARGVSLASNQVQYSLLSRSPERTGLMGACRELGVTLIAYSPLAMGVLTGKYDPQNPPPGLRRGRYRKRGLARTADLIEKIRDIGRAHGGKSPAQVALNWVIRKGALPIPGAKNGEQMEDNKGALGWELTPEDMAILDHAGGGIG
jgi:aryl-alcohol dehydrogenase-like predicted oxidoreductase